MSSDFGKSAFFVRNDAATLLQGPDALNVLDRLVSTNIADIPDMSRRDMIFCDYNGRMIDYAPIFTLSGSILLFSSDREQESIRGKLVDGKSWDEDCDIMIANEAIFRISIITEKPKDIFTSFEIEYEKVSSNRLVEGSDHIFSKLKHSSGEILEILVKSDNLESIKSKLCKMGCQEVDIEGWGSMRISLGIPSIDDYYGNLPEEMGMASLVSGEKGCYPGQEVHARIESRGRTVKNFCLLNGASPLQVGKHTESNLGTISVTSSSFSDGEANALALIRLKDSNPSFLNIEGDEFTFEKLIFPF